MGEVILTSECWSINDNFSNWLHPSSVHPRHKEIVVDNDDDVGLLGSAAAVDGDSASNVDSPVDDEAPAVSIVVSGGEME